MYSNQKLGKPEVFKQKESIDEELQRLCKIVENPAKIPDQTAWRGMGKVWKDRKAKQLELRSACEKYIKEAKKG